MTMIFGAGFIWKRLWWKRNDLRTLTFRRKESAFCAVCLHDMTEGDKFRRLPGCNHSFHVDCIDPWFESRSTCPLCRNQVPSLLPKHEHEQEQEHEQGCVEVFLWCLKIIVKVIESDRVPHRSQNVFPYGHASTYMFWLSDNSSSTFVYLRHCGVVGLISYVMVWLVPPTTPFVVRSGSY